MSRSLFIGVREGTIATSCPRFFPYGPACGALGAFAEDAAGRSRRPAVFRGRAAPRRVPLGMDSPTPDEVRRALAHLDARGQKIVIGLLALMMRNPQGVREREWTAEQLSQVTLLAGGFEADSPQAAVQGVRDFLQAHGQGLLGAALFLFQRLALDLAPRAAAGFTLEEALGCALEYLPSSETAAESAVPTPAEPPARDLGEQPLARLMAEHGLAPNDLVSASGEQLTHKMVARAMKGRRLTPNTMGKVRRAWVKVAPEAVRESALFDYEP